MMKRRIEGLDTTPEELDALVEQARAALDESGYQKLKAAVRTLGYVSTLLEDQQTTLQSLRNLLCAKRTEKTADVLKRSGVKMEETSSKSKPEAEPKPKAPGHGRHGANAYRGAPKVHVPHPSLKPGDACPECERGKVYLQAEPGVLVRLIGQAPVAATVYELDKYRCNLCGEVFTSKAPVGVEQEDKYDVTVASMIATLRYGSGFPMHRLEKMQDSLGIPLPASVQWEIVSGAAVRITAVFDELIRQAAQGEVLHNDDTSMMVLNLRREIDIEDETDGADRTGIFTSGIVSTREGCQIALFFTSRQHAGENLRDILMQRAASMRAPIQMCDALSRNMPKLPGKLEVIVSHCLAHARRRFVEVTPNFPEACRHVLEALGEVYHHDGLAHKRGLSPEERLLFHQQRSGPVMDNLYRWLKVQLEEKKVEPNSGLGGAITYLLKYWKRLTLFLRHAGAPLDNNVCERGLKKAILHRKNSLFYKTETGAHVGDIFMSVIHTAELCGANPFHYLTELQRHADELKKNPSQWMPWNYCATLQRADAAINSG